MGFNTKKLFHNKKIKNLTKSEIHKIVKKQVILVEKFNSITRCKLSKILFITQMFYAWDLGLAKDVAYPLFHTPSTGLHQFLPPFQPKRKNGNVRKRRPAPGARQIKQRKKCKEINLIKLNKMKLNQIKLIKLN